MEEAGPEEAALRVAFADLDVLDLRDHRADPRLAVGFVKVRADAVLEVLRLADVERPAFGVLHEVYAGRFGERLEDLLQLLGGHGGIIAKSGTRCRGLRW